MKLLSNNCKFSRLVSMFFSIGMLPLSSLENKDNTLTFVKFPIVEGIGPESLLAKRRMESKLTKSPIDCGIGPERLLSYN